MKSEVWCCHGMLAKPYRLFHPRFNAKIFGWFLSEVEYFERGMPYKVALSAFDDCCRVASEGLENVV